MQALESSRASARDPRRPYLRCIFLRSCMPAHASCTYAPRDRHIFPGGSPATNGPLISGFPIAVSPVTQGLLGFQQGDLVNYTPTVDF